VEEKNKRDRGSRARLAREQFLSATARLGLIKQGRTTFDNRHKEDSWYSERSVLVTENNQPNNSIIITVDSGSQSLRLKIVETQGDPIYIYIADP